MKHFWKRFCCFAVGISFLLSGCGSNAEKETVNGTGMVAMGRYIEKNIDPPPLDDNETVVSFFKNLDNELEVYVTNTVNYDVFRYVKKDGGSWERKEAKWLKDNGILPDNKDFYIKNIHLGQDGVYYCLYLDTQNKYQPYLVKSADGITLEKIPMEGFDKIIPGREYYPSANNFAVNSKGDIAVSYYNTIQLFHADGSRYPFEWSCGEQGETVAIQDEEVFAINEERTAAIAYSIATGEKNREIPLESASSFTTLAAGQDGAVYMLNANGICRAVKGGTTWENIVDGSLTSLSMPSYYDNKLIVGDNTDYFVCSKNDEGGNCFMQYVYDETVSAEPSIALSVYALQDSAVVRQAAVEFQRQHPDVRITFRIAMGEDSGTTAADNIRALNTELLNNKGADILILDGMPMNSYIEKGVLEDISDVIVPMAESGEILENIVENAKTNGKYYAVPTRIGLLTYIGNPEALSASDSLSDLAAYAEKIKEPLFGQISQRAFTREMFSAKANQVINVDKSLNQEAFTRFLMDLQTISSYMEIQEEGSSRYDGFSEFRLIEGDGKMMLKELKGLNDSMWATAIKNYIDSDIKLVNDAYIPHTIIGINHATEHMDIAKSFLKTMLSESVQASDQYEGFPVNPNALSRWNNLEKETSMAMTETDDFGNMTSLVAEWPPEEDRKQLTGFCRQASEEVIIDTVLVEMILNETNAFFAGEKSAEETAQAVSEKTKAYLAE